MAKKDTKRVSVNAWEKVMKEHFDTASVTVDWHGIEVEVKKILPLKDMIVFVEEIVDACFSKDGTFLPQTEKFAIRSGILTHYAGFAMPESLEKQYDMVMKTDAVEAVSAYIDETQLEDIIDAAERKIDFLCDSNALTIKAEAEKVVAQFHSLGEQMEAVFSGMTADDIQRIVETAGKLGEVDEGKIVEAYIDKKREAEAAEAAGMEDIPEDVTKGDVSKSGGEAE